MNKRGAALIITFAIIIILVILGTAIFSRSVSESDAARRYAESTRAFWIAEAGVNRALYELRNNYNLNAISATSYGDGGYQVTITQSGENRTVSAIGYIPFTGTTRATRTIEALMSKYVPPNFYDNAIYSGGDVDFNGNAYVVNGKVRYADEIEYSHNNVNGTITEDPSISPLPRFDFQQLYNLSLGQQNVYVVSGNKLVNQVTGSEDFPAAFWYNASSSTPNIVYIEGDLTLNGNIGTIGGFFVVVGDVITNPGAEENTTINGNGQIDGVIYTRGDFDINGGGGNLNVNGGIWAGEEAELNGNANVSYNQTYMEAVQYLNLTTSVQVSSWNDMQKPYPLTP